jgi:hypothetical protein
MKNKKLAAVFVTPIALAGLLFSTATFSTAGATEPGAPLGVVTTTSSDVGTRPQCAWSLSGVASTTSISGAAGTKYDGTLYALSGSDADVSAAVVSGSLGEACSWYTYKKGANITVTTATGPGFSANMELDTSMDFELTSSNAMDLSITSSCIPDWTNSLSATIYGTAPNLSATPISLAKDKTATDSACTYSMTIDTTIPALKAPKDAGSIYALTGPPLTTTLLLAD